MKSAWRRSEGATFAAGLGMAWAFMNQAAPTMPTPAAKVFCSVVNQAAHFSQGETLAVVGDQIGPPQAFEQGPEVVVDGHPEGLLVVGTVKGFSVT